MFPRFMLIIVKKVQLIEEEYIVLNYIEIACNINTFEDLKITEKLDGKF